MTVPVIQEDAEIITDRILRLRYNTPIECVPPDPFKILEPPNKVYVGNNQCETAHQPEDKRFIDLYLESNPIELDDNAVYEFVTPAVRSLDTGDDEVAPTPNPLPLVLRRYTSLKRRNIRIRRIGAR